MPRKTATPLPDPIPPLEHEAAVKTITVVGKPLDATHKCPQCGGKSGYKDYKDGDRGSRSHWACCYQWCECDDVDDGEPHLILSEDWCDTCDTHTGCECDECQNCTNTKSCSICDSCGDCCSCWYCSGCAETQSEHETCCGTCSYCESCCSCHYCEGCYETIYEHDWCSDCDTCHSCCSCNEEEDDEPSHGTTETIPWKVEPGYVDPQYQRYAKVDPVRGMAEHYLLAYCESPIDAPIAAQCYAEHVEALAVLTSLAKQAKEEVIAAMDEALVPYVDMAIGGELRHHKATKPWLYGERAEAWGKWPIVRKELGPKALTDAAMLFREMGGGFGGELWALAAEVLHARITDKFPPWLFVDRVFTMQHNGGSLLNKVAWANDTNLAVNVAFCTTVGMAHAAENPDLALLMFLARPEIRELFRQWWMARNRVFVASDQRPMVLPRPKIMVEAYSGGYLRTQSGTWALTPSFAQSVRRSRNLNKADVEPTAQMGFNFKEAAALAALEEKLAAVEGEVTSGEFLNILYSLDDISSTLKHTLYKDFVAKEQAAKEAALEKALAEAKMMNDAALAAKEALSTQPTTTSKGAQHD